MKNLITIFGKAAEFRSTTLFKKKKRHFQSYSSKVVLMDFYIFLGNSVTSFYYPISLYFITGNTGCFSYVLASVPLNKTTFIN